MIKYYEYIKKKKKTERIIYFKIKLYKNKVNDCTIKIK